MMIKDLTVSGFRHGDGTIVGSAQEGTLGTTREMFEGVSQLTDQEIQELELGDPANVREQAKKALVEINKVEEIYNRNAEKVHGTPIDEVINVYLSEQEYINEINKETISQYSNEIIRLYEDSATQQLIKDLDGGKREYLSKTRELTNLQQVKRIFDDYKELLKTSEIEPILFINEADGFFSKRQNLGTKSSSVVQTQNTIQNIILQELEIFNGILIATTK